MSNYVAKPVEVQAFTYGKETQPAWFLKAVRERKFKVIPSVGTIVAKTKDGQYNLYDPRTFNALFESTESAEDLDKDGEVDAREKAIASETKNKRKSAKKKE